MKRLHRRQFLQVATAVALVGAGRGLRAQFKPERRQIMLAVDDRSSLLHLPLVLADQLGYFRAEGVQVLLAEMTPTVPAWQALSSGADVVAGGFDQVLQQQARGHALRALVLQTRAPQAVLGVSPKTLPHFRDIRDLKGRRVGVSELGNQAHRLVQQALARTDAPVGGVEFVELGPGWGALNAYRTAQIDALCHVDPLISMLEQHGEVRVIADTRSYTETVSLFGGPMPSSCLYTNEAFWSAHPQTCEALVHAMVRALKWLQTATLSDIIKTVPERLLGDRALYLAAFNKARSSFTTDGLMPAGGLQTLQQHLARFDETLRGSTLDLSRTFSNEMAARAKARYKA